MSWSYLHAIFTFVGIWINQLMKQHIRPVSKYITIYAYDNIMNLWNFLANANIWFFDIPIILQLNFYSHSTQRRSKHDISSLYLGQMLQTIPAIKQTTTDNHI